MSISNYLQVQNDLSSRLNKFLDELPTPIEQFNDNYGRISFFIYFLTVKEGEGVALRSSIRQIFELADLKKPSNLDRDIKVMVGSSRILPLAEGFRLHRKELARVEEELKVRQRVTALKKNLLDLADKIQNDTERNFIEEAIRCFGTRPPAKRATVILTWIICIDHLQNFILKNKRMLTALNMALSRGNQKLRKVSRKEDFSEMDESVFLTRIREAKITDTNIHKQLEEYLRFRDSCAHPNTLQISDARVEAFVEDIIKNILFRFKM